MKMSYEWIKEYVNLDVGPEELALGLTMSGSEVETINDAGSDKVMSLEITSNRPDCLNMVGLAREASVVFDRELKAPDIKPFKSVPEEKGPVVDCVIENTELCPKYTARIIIGVKIREAGEKIRKRLEALGLRPVNNAVDVTNFCLMELGQPLHAFDLDKLKGGKIIVREARKGERIVTIDEVERELEKGMLVIADKERPVAIAGVMGGIDTEVTETTKNILLESAYFDPVSVRRTSRKLGILSDSSYRFERGVDKGMIKGASDRAASLIVKEAGGKVCGFYEAGPLSAGENVIEFDTEKAGKILGVQVEKKWVKHIFQKLGMTITDKGGSRMSVRVPTFREDLEREIDLIEEAARILGYDKIPATIPEISPATERKVHERQVNEKLLEDLVAFGLNEIVTYGLISEASSSRFPGLVKNPITLSNPLSEEQKAMTPHLLDGMLKTISWNINRKNKDLRLFEIGKIYSDLGKGKGYGEVPTLCIGLTGLARQNWMEGKRNESFYDLKGIIEDIFYGVRITPEFTSIHVDGIAPCAGIKIHGEKETIGFLGQVTKEILNEYDIEQDVFLCQLKLDRIFEKAVLKNRYHSIPRFPFSTRDVSILSDESIRAGDILKIIAETGEELIRKIDLVDIYKGKKIPKGKKSLTYSIQYGLDTRTLREEEIEALHSSVKDALAKKLGVTFR